MEEKEEAPVAAGSTTIASITTSLLITSVNYSETYM